MRVVAPWAVTVAVVTHATSRAFGASPPGSLGSPWLYLTVSVLALFAGIVFGVQASSSEREDESAYDYVACATAIVESVRALATSRLGESNRRIR